MSKVKDKEEQKPPEDELPPEDTDEEGEEDEEDDDEDIDLDDVDVGALINAVEESEEKIDLLEKRVESMDRAFFSCLLGLVKTIDQMETVVNPLAEPEDKAKALTAVQRTLDVMKDFLKDK